MTPAATTISGNGICRKKIATKASAAMPTRREDFSARRPIRMIASITITSTAAFDAEQRAVDQRDPARQRIEHAQAQHEQRARQDEQEAGDQSAGRAMHQPADIGASWVASGPGSSMQ